MRIDYSKRLCLVNFFFFYYFCFLNVSTAFNGTHFIFCKMTEMLLYGSWNVSANGLVRLPSYGLFSKQCSIFRICIHRNYCILDMCFNVAVIDFYYMEPQETKTFWISNSNASTLVLYTVTDDDVFL